MSNYTDELINNYNCPDCNKAKLQSDKNARKINEVIDQVNGLIQVNNETVDFIEDKANEKVTEIAEIKVNEVLGDLRTEIDNIHTSLDNIAYKLKPRNTGEIDDTERVKRTLADLPSGATLHLDDITISSTIIINKDITITSLNKSKRAKITCNTDIHTGLLAETDGLTINIENIEFCGGVIDRGDTYSRDRDKNPSFKVALGVSYAKELNVRNCFFRNIEDIPTYFFKNKSINFINNYSDYCLDLGFADNDKIIFDGNKITRSGDNGFSISKFNKQCVITNNIIEDSYFSGIFVAGFAEEYGVEDFICTNNVIINSNRYGIQVDAGSDKFIIANNYIKNVTRKYESFNPGYAGGIGILCAIHSQKPICEFFSITNNTLIDCYRGGMLLNGMQYGKVTDNLICNPGSKYYDNSNVVVDRVDSKNQPNNYHIALISGSNNIIVENNSLIDNRTDKSILKYCIFINNSINNCSIKNNTLKGVPQQFHDISIDIAKKNTNKWYSNMFLQSKNFENGNGYSNKFGKATLSIMENKLNINCLSNQDCGVYVSLNNYCFKNKITYDITFKSNADIDSVGFLFDFMKTDGGKDRKIIKFKDIIKNYSPNTYYSVSGVLETSILQSDFNGYQCIICGNMNSINSNRTGKDVEILYFNLY